MVKVLIAGDFCQRYRVDEAVVNHRYAELFSCVTPFLGKTDYNIVNFEFPIVVDDPDARPIRKCGPLLRGTVEAVDAIKYAGFNCCTLANNHILDQGEMCCMDTIDKLNLGGIDTVGAGKDSAEAAKILYKNINTETIAVINCCEHEFSISSNNSAGANPLNPIRQFYDIQAAREKSDYVIVIVHGGHEHHQLPSPRMQEIYRFFIDAGADAVVNHHQHCYSGYEEYKEKPIFYGLGNFCFDDLRCRDTMWNKGYMVMLSFRQGSKPSYEIIPYTQCGDEIGVIPMEDRDQFYAHLAQLNNVIADESLLKESTESYYGDCCKYESDLFSPWLNRVFRRFHLPRKISLRYSECYMLSVWNHVECESHRDKLDYMFRRVISEAYK